MAKWEQSRNNNYWHVKQDATCGLLGKGYDKGWEVASYVGRGDGDIRHIGMVAEALGKAGCQTNQHCGLHIHVEVIDFSVEEIAILMAYYAKIEWLILAITPKHRHLNPYCDPLYFSEKECRKRWTPVELWKALRPKNLSSFDNPYRWRSVNLVNFARHEDDRCTLEFRLPECTLNKVPVTNWTRLFVNFVDWTKGRLMPPDLTPAPLHTSLYHLGLWHDTETFNIFSKELFATKSWLLHRFLSMSKDESARKILNDMWNPVRDF